MRRLLIRCWKWRPLLFNLLFLSGCSSPLWAQQGGYGILSGDTLRLGNDRIERVFVLQQGILSSLSFENKKAKYNCRMAVPLPCFQLRGLPSKAGTAVFST